MRILSRSSQEELWAQIRRRMLLETSVFLTNCLRRPELGVSIPIIRAGQGRFTKAFAERFWQQVLADA